MDRKVFTDKKLNFKFLKKVIFICKAFLIVSLKQYIWGALYLHFPLSMKNPRVHNFIDKKSPLYKKYSRVYEMSYL